MKSNTLLWRRIILVGPFLSVVLIGLLKELLRVGVGHMEAYRLDIIIMYGLFMVGGVLGYLLVQADWLLAKYHVQIPGAEQAVSQWSRALRNVLTCVILSVLGIWIVTSSVSPLGWGVVLGLQLRLFTELAFAADYSGWYWIFARQFSIREHRFFLLVWAGLLFVQWLVLL